MQAFPRAVKTASAGPIGRRTKRPWWSAFLRFAAITCLVAGWPSLLLAQAPAPASTASGTSSNDRFEAAFAENTAAEPVTAQAPVVAPKPADNQLNLLNLILAGGPLMIPIGIMSLVVVFYGAERFLGLRRNRVVPADFVQGLGQLAKSPGGLDPRLAYRLCQRYRCSAANVVRAALLKLGRPHSEVEKAVQESMEKEANLLYSNVRPIGMAMSISPLLGLLGTVWGMVETFFVVSKSTGGVKVVDLAGGIYVALVTTVAGLAVAIPAALLAYYFEGRIQRLFRQVDDVMQSLLPQLERYEGKLRVTTLDGTAPAEPPPVPQPPPAPPVAKHAAGTGHVQAVLKK